MKRTISYNKIVFLAILTVGICLRLYKWNSYGFWIDEVGWWAISPYHGLFNTLRNSIWLGKPPLFRFLVYVWSTFAGYNEFALRLLPVTFGILSIILIYRTGKEFFGEQTGILASLLLALSPFHIYYSQEFTHYSLTVLLCLGSIHFLLEALNRNTPSAWIKFVISTTLALYTNYICIPLFLLVNIFFFSGPYRRDESCLGKWVMSQAAIILLYTPWLILFPRQISIIHNYLSIKWIPQGSAANIFQLFRLFNAGYNANFLIHSLSGMFFFPLFVMGILKSWGQHRQTTILFLTWIFFPILSAILFSAVFPIFAYRYFIFILPAYYLLAAHGLVQTGKWRLGLVAAYIILTGFALSNYYQDIFPYPKDFYHPGIHQKKQNRESSRYIIDHLKKDDLVIHTCPSTAGPYYYYLSLANRKDAREIPTWDVKSLFSKVPGFTRNGIDEYYQMYGREKVESFIAQEKPARIWLVVSHWTPEFLAKTPDMIENKIKRWMQENFVLLDHKQFTGIEVFLYKGKK